ncbi:hypothetical protein DB347_23125 [Opitutaceae bacterium EW11]|nr:hypothetical protein DB347_23125 [Opitutaceae bacterium EW11]
MEHALIVPSPRHPHSPARRRTTRPTAHGSAKTGGISPRSRGGLAMMVPLIVLAAFVIVVALDTSDLEE